MHVVEHAAAADDTHLRREVSPLREGGWGPKRSLNAKLVAVCRFFGDPHPEKSTGHVADWHTAPREPCGLLVLVPCEVAF